FAALDQWGGSDPRAALSAFAASCGKIMKRPDAEAFGGSPDYGIVGDWKPACAATLNTHDFPADAARGFFGAWFTPAAVTNHGDAIGLFTGYYEPELNGSRKKQGRFQTPLLARPADLVMVDLGTF